MHEKKYTRVQLFPYFASGYISRKETRGCDYTEVGSTIERVMKNTILRTIIRYQGKLLSLFRTRNPVSRIFGIERGTAIDRIYIQKFLEENRPYIRGNILEVGDDTYTKKFAPPGSKSTILLYKDEGDSSKKYLIGDLTKDVSLPKDAFDCFICTQTLNFIFDLPTAVKNINHLLKPGGTALITVGGISQISRYDMDRWGDYWRFTHASLSRLFNSVFGEKNVSVKTWGNFRAAVEFLNGRAAEELTRPELEPVDPDYQIIISAVAKKQ